MIKSFTVCEKFTVKVEIPAGCLKNPAGKKNPAGFLENPMGIISLNT